MADDRTVSFPRDWSDAEVIQRLRAAIRRHRPGTAFELVDHLVCRYASVSEVNRAAIAWVETITSHPNQWAGQEDKDLIRAVRRRKLDVHLPWLERPEYAGWPDSTAPEDECPPVDRPEGEQ